MSLYYGAASVVCPSVNFCANRFFSHTNGGIATKLAHDGLQVSVHPGCAQGQGQRSHDTHTFLDSWNELLRHWRSGYYYLACIVAILLLLSSAFFLSFLLLFVFVCNCVFCIFVLFWCQLLCGFSLMSMNITASGADLFLELINSVIKKFSLMRIKATNDRALFC